MPIVIATSLKAGKIFQENEIPFQVVKYEHIKVARGGANVKIKARNLLNGSVLEKTYLSTAKVSEADVSRSNAIYLYKDNLGFVFMDPVNYENFTISQKVVGESSKFLRDGDKVILLNYNSKPISVELPKTVVLEVAYTEPGYKGNTVSNTFKDAKLENDTVVKVPNFVKNGDKIKINTASGEYVSKA